MKGGVWWRAKVSRQFVLWKEGLKGLIIETSVNITMIRYYRRNVFMIVIETPENKVLLTLRFGLLLKQLNFCISKLMLWFTTSICVHESSSGIIAGCRYLPSAISSECSKFMPLMLIISKNIKLYIDNHFKKQTL